MNSAARKMRRLPAAQILLTAITSGSFWLFSGFSAGQAALFGGAIAVINSLIQLWHMHRAETSAGCSIDQNMRIFYRCSIERLLSTAALFAIGLGVLKLLPLPMVIGFVVAQGAIFYEGVMTRYYGQ
ncbi:MAG: ATP synthase subunit I [Gammaproteobacteria bacterium]|nr:ATP synthase subunit I [Gammaproteobacteria bacterium]MDH5593423.1 ATP synthase subunit I [Gammaproteobacteria bacterium]MDH5613456.1 ATP synthase subunit I [Gammaproteobacteria bacterium]